MSDRSLLVNLSALMQKPTGISVYTRNLLPELAALSPIVLSNQKTTSDYTNITQINIPDRLSPEYGYEGHARRLWWMQSTLPKLYRELGSPLIFSPLPEAPIYTECRFIVTAHDLIPLRFPQKWSLSTNYFRYVVPKILKEAVHIVANSYATARDLERFYNISSRKITPVPLAYDRETFKRYDPSDSQLEERYFLYIGRQNAYKNLSRLIEAFSQISQSTAAQLWLVGPSDQRYTAQLTAQAESLGVAASVRFLDYVAHAELPKLLNNAIALTFPSLWEGFGLPVLEAMACGTPVITSNLSSLPEVAGDVAILIDPYNVDELADAMRMVASDAQLRQQLKTAGIKRAQLFSWEKTGQQTVDILKRYM